METLKSFPKETGVSSPTDNVVQRTSPAVGKALSASAGL